MSRPDDPYWTHPAKGLAQAPRKERAPIDRASFIRPAVLRECTKVCIACHIPATWADREDLLVMEVLAEELREHFRREHLIEVRIRPGMTLKAVVTEAASVLATAQEERRAARRMAEAAAN